MKTNKILFVLTSHDVKGTTGKPTGFHLSEASHPWKVLVEAGYEIDFVSPKGGQAPVTAFDLNDAENRLLWENVIYRAKIEDTLRPDQVNAAEYDAIYFVGGHGTMWDFPDNAELAQITREIYEKGGVVAAVCHGPAALVNVKLSDGSYLVDDKRVNSFTNEEEEAAGLTNVVPFLLESKLIERGAWFEKSPKSEAHLAVDQRLVTGQNPASATLVGEAMVEELEKAHARHRVGFSAV